MPSAEDIKRIHAEEMLRQEIREEIEASKNQRPAKDQDRSFLKNSWIF